MPYLNVIINHILDIIAKNKEMLNHVIMCKFKDESICFTDIYFYPVVVTFSCLLGCKAIMTHP